MFSPGNSGTVQKLDREAERDGQGLERQELAERTKGWRMRDAGPVQEDQRGLSISWAAGEHGDSSATGWSH